MKFIKKLQSTLLAVCVAFGCFVSVAPAQSTASEITVSDIPTDHNAGTVTLNTNLLAVNSKSAAYNIYAASGRNSTNITVSRLENNWVNDGISNHFDTKTITVGSSDVTSPSGSAYAGIVLKASDSKFTVSNFDPEKTYVFRMQAKNAGTTENVRVGVGISNDSLASEACTKEYDAAGMLLTSEYQEFKGTIKPSDKYSKDASNHVMIIGVPVGTPAGSVVHLDITEADDFYFAEEQAYDITNTAVSSEVFAGASVELKAEVVNQLGIPGYLSQNFSWYVLNEGKTEFADGFEITTDAATQTATLKVADTVESGTYSVVAVSNDYQMAKTKTITVKSAAFKDHVPDEKSANLLTLTSTTNSSGIQSAASNIYSSSARNNSYISVANGSFDNWVASANGGHTDKKVLTVGASNVVQEGASVFGGLVIRNIDNRFSVSSFDADKNYVISFKAKNAGTTKNVEIGASMSNDSLASESFTDNYGSEGMLLTSEYQEFKGTIQPNSSYSTDAEKHNVVIGVPAGTAANSIVHIDITDDDAVYLAEEQAYDITNTNLTGKTELAYGETAAFKAEITNQLEDTGCLDQSVVWYAMNKDRTEFVDGIEVTANGSTANIEVTDTVPEGTYTIIAYSEKYGMAKGCDIDVVELKIESVSAFSMLQIEDKIFCEADVINTDASSVLLALGEYDSNDMLVQVNTAQAAVTNGKASGGLVLSGASAGNKVKAFVWKSDSITPVPNINGYNMEITVKSTDELYGSKLSESEYEEPAATDFYNNKKAAVSVTFDDSIYSAAEYYDSLFELYGMHGTAVLVSDSISDTQVSQWQALIDNGNIDIANHSKSHNIRYSTDNPTAEQLAEDITGGYNALKEMFPNEQILAFAAPWTQSPEAALTEIKKLHYANRNGGSGFVDPNPTEDIWYDLPGYVVYNTDTASALNAKIDTAINNGQWFIHLMHGVGSGTYNIDKDVCAEHFAYIGSKSNDVWAGSMNEVTKYIYERQNAEITCNWIRENAISISITDTLDDTLFDFPLTIKVNVPTGWTDVAVYTDGEITTVQTVTETDGNYVYVNAVPDNGEVILKRI